MSLLCNDPSPLQTGKKKQYWIHTFKFIPPALSTLKSLSIKPVNYFLMSMLRFSWGKAPSRDDCYSWNFNGFVFHNNWNHYWVKTWAAFRDLSRNESFGSCYPKWLHHSLIFIECCLHSHEMETVSVLPSFLTWQIRSWG